MKEESGTRDWKRKAEETGIEKAEETGIEKTEETGIEKTEEEMEENITGESLDKEDVFP